MSIATATTATKLHFFVIIQKIKHRILAARIAGKAIPINEKKAVLRGDTYQAGKDRKRNKMDINVITTNIDFVIFRSIIWCLFYFLPASNNCRFSSAVRLLYPDCLSLSSMASIFFDSWVFL